MTKLEKCKEANSLSFNLEHVKHCDFCKGYVIGYLEIDITLWEKSK